VQAAQGLRVRPELRKRPVLPTTRAVPQFGRMLAGRIDAFLRVGAFSRVIFPLWGGEVAGCPLVAFGHPTVNIASAIRPPGLCPAGVTAEPPGWGESARGASDSGISRHPFRLECSEGGGRVSRGRERDLLLQFVQRDGALGPPIFNLANASAS
jgi:hypothetical protein